MARGRVGDALATNELTGNAADKAPSRNICVVSAWNRKTR